MRDLRRAIPEEDLRSTAIDDLCRVRRSLVGGGRLKDEECERLGTARSIRRTEAPLSARRRPAKGPVGKEVSYASIRGWMRV
jgi:hypothetical protein